MGVGGGPSAKRRHGSCGVAPGKTAGTGSPAPPLVPVSCRYLLVSATLSFFPHRRGKFWPYLEKLSNPRACDRVGVVGGRGPCHSSPLW